VTSSRVDLHNSNPLANRCRYHEIAESIKLDSSYSAPVDWAADLRRDLWRVMTRKYGIPIAVKRVAQCLCCMVGIHAATVTRIRRARFKVCRFIREIGINLLTPVWMAVGAADHPQVFCNCWFLCPADLQCGHGF